VKNFISFHFIVSRVGIWEGLSGGSVLGFMSEVMLVLMRVWGVHVRLMTMGTMSPWVPRQCDRSAFVRGCIFLLLGDGCL
jgi:hypothetical protein